LDDGRLTDNKGRTANFKNTIVIMTSNIGSHIIQEGFDNMDEANYDETLAKTKNNVMELLRKQIRPEFLNRIDDIIMFTPLNRDNVRQIVNMHFEGIKQTLLNQQIDLQITDEAMDWLTQLGYDPQYGARPLKRVLQRRILNELSKAILSGAVKKDSNILISLDNKQQFVFENK
jgi:ATP-dependent Clp protease ATP-binding subunit ClpB